MRKILGDRHSLLYLTLSASSGLLELGVVLLALRQGAPIGVALVVGFCYQLGALSKNPFHFPMWGYRVLLAGAVVVGIFAPYSPVVLAISVALVAAGLQGVRDGASQMTTIGTLPKRLSRVLGFAAAGFFYPLLLPILAAVCLAASFALSNMPGSPWSMGIQRNWRLGKLGIIMVTHQAHYFCYAYALPYLLIQYVPVVGVGLIFAVGWITYAFSQAIFRKAREINGFVFGHLFASAMLLVIFLGHENIWAVLGGWLLTGFGGGTIFLLRRLQSKIGTEEVDLDLWENIGHAAGVLISIMVVQIFPTPVVLFAVGAMLAISAATQLIIRVPGRLVAAGEGLLPG